MSDQDRRTFIKGLTGLLAFAGVGTGAGHPSDDSSHDIHVHDATRNAERIGFHTLATKGGESRNGPDNPLYGMITDPWIEGDLAFVSMQSTSRPTGNRGVAILDVSDYTRAETLAEAREGEMNLLSFIGNESEAGTANDVKVSDDGQYLFYSKQAIGADYGQPASASTDSHEATGAEPLGLIAYDISDPANPEYVAHTTGPNAGFHNCFTHRIGGDHYAFGVQGAVYGDAGVHVYRLNETAGELEPVNFWGGGDAPVTGYGTNVINYCHDFYAHDDPVTGKPVGYIAYWDAGVQVIDLSDPTDIEWLGVGPMEVAHYAQPAPALIDGKRVFIGGQEHGSRAADFSGYVKLFDGDSLFDEGGECEVLDEYTLYDNVSYEGYMFSPHNADVTEDGWITQAHYHAGVQYLKIQPPAESATGDWRLAGRRIRDGGSDPNEEDPVPILLPDNELHPERTEAGTVVEQGPAFYRDHVEVPGDSMTDDQVAPNFWGARITNGITFAADQHTGLYAIAADPIDVGTRTPAAVNVTRRDDGVVFTGGMTNRLVYEVETDTTITLRDRLPADWTVEGGDPVETTDVGDGTRVVFDDPVDPTGHRETATRVLYVDVGDAGANKVGPVRYSTTAEPSAGGKDWEPVPGTAETNLVGPSQF